MFEESTPSYAALVRWCERYPRHREALEDFFAVWATCGPPPVTLRSFSACRRQIGKRMPYALLNLISTVITIFIWLLIAQAVLSWLLAFGVVNRYNRVVASVNDFLWRITEPVLRPIRSVLPDLGGIDISPVILILVLYFLRDLMFEYLA